MLFVLPNLVEALVHGVVEARPAALTLAAATHEAVETAVAYVHARAAGSP